MDFNVHDYIVLDGAPNKRRWKLGNGWVFLSDQQCKMCQAECRARNRALRETEAAVSAQTGQGQCLIYLQS